MSRPGAHPSAKPRWLVPTTPRPRLTASCTRRPAMDARYSSTAQFPYTPLYANEEPGRGHLSPISDSPFAPGTFSRAQPSWQGTWLVFRARDFRVFQRADAPFFWAVELRVHDYKGCSCDMRERERENVWLRPRRAMRRPVLSCLVGGASGWFGRFETQHRNFLMKHKRKLFSLLSSLLVWGLCANLCARSLRAGSVLYYINTSLGISLHSPDSA